MARCPHRLIVHKPSPVVLSFWTAQAAQIAGNASTYEREGKLEQAADCWQSARNLTPADGATRAYCFERERICNLVDPREPVAA